MNRYSLVVLLAAGLLGGTSACNVLPAMAKQNTIYYDLQSPETIDCIPIHIHIFSTMTGERFRVTYRQKGIKIVGLESCKWVQTPGAMVTRYLCLAFRNSGQIADKKPMAANLKGEILIFEVNKGNAEVGIRYHLRYAGKEIKRTVLFSTPVKERTTDAMVYALSQSVKQFACQIAAEANQLAGKK